MDRGAWWGCKGSDMTEHTLLPSFLTTIYKIDNQQGPTYSTGNSAPCSAVGLPGVPVGMNPPAKAGGTGLNRGSGRSHIWWSN